MILGRMIEYYRRKDTELLEKALLNVDLTKCSNILEIRHICETEYLTSALIHLLTNLFDKENEVSNYYLSYRIQFVFSYFALYLT